MKQLSDNHCGVFIQFYSNHSFIQLFRGKDVRRFNYQALFPNACRNKNG